MSQRLRILLGQRWGGLALALAVAALSLLLFLISSIAGWLLAGLALLMLLGVAAAEIQRWMAPAEPGRIHTVNGRRVHLLAEGVCEGTHPIIWVAGGHGEGLIMHHLHRAIRDETRSILFDRTGSGWTDPAVRPVTLSGEVQQLHDLLRTAGEQGPWVLAGHSFGGLFSVNYANRYPEDVAGLLLLDSTPSWNVGYAGPLSFNGILRAAWIGALKSHFGLQRWVEPEIDDPDSDLARELADVQRQVNHNSVQPKSLLAEASVFRSSMDNPFDVAVAPGALGEIPLLLMAARIRDEDREKVNELLRERMGLDEVQLKNFWDGFDLGEDHQVTLSHAGRRRYMPEGSSHMFPYEHPKLVLDEAREMIQRRPAE